MAAGSALFGLLPGRRPRAGAALVILSGALTVVVAVARTARRSRPPAWPGRVPGPSRPGTWCTTSCPWCSSCSSCWPCSC
jgi:hypothetical protein